MARSSVAAGGRAAGLLLGFANSFPSSSHSVLFAVLGRMRLPARLLALVEAMYRLVCSDISFGGAVWEKMPLGAGIRQGCPLSRLVFALCLDLLIRCALSCQASSRSTLAAYDDDLALVFWDMRAQR